MFALQADFLKNSSFLMQIFAIPSYIEYRDSKYDN